MSKENEYDGLFACTLCHRRMPQEELALQIWAGYNCKPQRLDVCPVCASKHEDELTMLKSALKVLEQKLFRIKTSEGLIQQIVSKMIPKESEEQNGNQG